MPSSLLAHKAIIDGKPIHIATVAPDNNPNLAVASDVKVLDDNRLLISVNEMAHTQENIAKNPCVVITAFDPDWKGVRIFGEAKFYADGEFYELCEKLFFAQGETTPFGATKPKGAIVVNVERVEEMV